jgi:tRNA(adenine34) deaminase
MLNLDEKIVYEKFMNIAVEEAEKAYIEDEVPIGAVLVIDNEVISRNHNRNRQLTDPTAHAEILVLREAAKKLGCFRILNSILFVTMEPCPMCAGAMLYSRIGKIVYGCADLKAGCDTSVCNILNNEKFNHRVEVIRNFNEKKCKYLLQKFFKEKRLLRKNAN